MSSEAPQGAAATGAAAPVPAGGEKPTQVGWEGLGYMYVGWDMGACARFVVGCRGKRGLAGGNG